MIIGLSGYARAGKDTVGQILVDELCFERVSFADKLKEVHLLLYPEQWDWAKEDQRPYLQNLGTTMRDHVNKDVWVDAALPLYGSYQNRNIVVTDVRFPNEYRRIERLGGYAVRVDRVGYGPVNDHESETALDQAFNWDVTLLNDDTLAALRHKVIHHLIPALCGREAS